MIRTGTMLKGLLVVLLAVGAAGCDMLEDLVEKDKEAAGVVEAIGEASLTVGGIAYGVTSETEYEGVAGLADLSIGDEVEIEYKEEGGARVAVEIELAGNEDDD